MVKQAGPLALIQDAGRFGVGHLGVTQGGAADWISFRWANWLLGNAPNSAALEIVMGGGLSLEAESEVRLALTGADLDASWMANRSRPMSVLNSYPASVWYFASRARVCAPISPSQAG